MPACFLILFKVLQGEENNLYRITRLLGKEILDEAGKINVIEIVKDEDGKIERTEKSLASVFYEKYLNRKYIND